MFVLSGHTCKTLFRQFAGLSLYQILILKSMLYTNLKHIETASEYTRIISENENVIIICGRMEPICILVYRIAEIFEKQFSHVKFFDMEFDNPEADVIRDLLKVKGFMGIPFTIYYKNGKVVKATTSIQNPEQIKSILEKEFAIPVNV